MKGYLLSVWNTLDPLYFMCTRLNYLPEKEFKNIFRVRLTRYKGVDVTLSDGTQIKKNDTCVKIHLHNIRLLNELKLIKSEVKKAKIIYRNVQRSLPGIEEYIRNHKNFNDIKGIIGITVLNKVCDRLGFEVVEISNPVYKRFKWVTFFPIIFLSSTEASNKNILKHPAPSYLFISKEKLSKLYRT
ncbi:hypothetical protein ELQ35_10410 [Peribacillus cavernae]|uniref:YkoP-like domain-containing protein n=1 Tax=Peribacillus cavernae TaxID=1674310 RepID=A0A3S0VNF3_9BACI|nr:hypothetical protein [Peribacillus cavernae]MDQ0218921.1 transposase-like protein [Peribacillus cavernae]RUQ29365.1 hypothetical protein ELQ35_10410 [Peribacillus cavernae]